MCSIKWLLYLHLLSVLRGNSLSMLEFPFLNRCYKKENIMVKNTNRSFLSYVHDAFHQKPHTKYPIHCWPQIIAACEKSNIKLKQTQIEQICTAIIKIWAAGNLDLEETKYTKYYIKHCSFTSTNSEIDSMFQQFRDRVPTMFQVQFT